MYNSASFYFMSGTGNSFKTAVWAAETLKAPDKTKITPIEKASFAAPAERGSKLAMYPSETSGSWPPLCETNLKHLTGLFFPTHAFTAPWPVIKFALSMPSSKGSPVIVAATRGGAFYPFALPGMEGTACLIPALILAVKGYDVKGFSGFDMPVNWLAVHWGMNRKHAEFFYSKTKNEISVFISKINSGKRAYKSIPSWITGALLLFPSFMYVLFARLMLAKVMFADETCDGCGICAKYCRAS